MFVTTDRSWVRRTASILFLMACLAALSGCGGGDPKADLLAERSQWEVELRSFRLSDVSAVASLKVKGPTQTELEKLTVLFYLMDAEGNRVDSIWHTLDVSAVRRGVSKDMVVTLPTGGIEFDGLQLDPVFAPTAEQEGFLEELAGIESK
ncbi:hypothetical protein ABI59_04735 [Acidobacteria bacterium Mor1]|nr:hypothetical protein ABI59_04735 [Acidobacteria bacterium Mor1]